MLIVELSSKMTINRCGDVKIVRKQQKHKLERKMALSKEIDVLTKKSFPILAFFVVLLSSIFLVACGWGGEKPLTTINVDMTDHQFTPNEFTVQAGAEITLNLNNIGKQPHEFQILVLGAKVYESVDKDGNPTKYWSAIARPGESESLSFTAPSEPGSYAIKCSAPGHMQAGMVGTLHVK